MAHRLQSFHDRHSLQIWHRATLPLLIVAIAFASRGYSQDASATTEPAVASTIDPIPRDADASVDLGEVTDLVQKSRTRTKAPQNSPSQAELVNHVIQYAEAYRRHWMRYRLTIEPKDKAEMELLDSQGYLRGKHHDLVLESAQWDKWAWHRLVSYHRDGKPVHNRQESAFLVHDYSAREGGDRDAYPLIGVFPANIGADAKLTLSELWSSDPDKITLAGWEDDAAILKFRLMQEQSQLTVELKLTPIPNGGWVPTRCDVYPIALDGETNPIPLSEWEVHKIRSWTDGRTPRIEAGVVRISAPLAASFRKDTVATIQFQVEEAKYGSEFDPAAMNMLVPTEILGSSAEATAAEASIDVTATAADMSTPRVIIIETTPDIERSEVIRKVVEALEKDNRTQRATDDRQGKPIGYLAQIMPKPDTDYKLIVALINDLKEAGIERFVFAPSSDQSNTVEVTVPVEVTWRHVRQIQAAMAKHPTFQTGVYSAGNNDPVTSSMQPSNRDGTMMGGLGADPKSEPAARADSTDATDPFARCKFYLQQHIRAADVARIVEQLHGHADADANALTVDVEESTNSINVHGRVAVLNEIQALLNHLHAGSKKADDDAPSANDSMFESAKDLDIGVRNPAPRPLPRILDFPKPAEKADDRTFRLMFGNDTARVAETADQLRAASNDRERESRALAKQLREPLPDPTTGDKLKAALRDIVRQAFETRQKLQRAELAEFAQRLQRIQQSIETRDSIAEQIIDRRVDELLDPNLKWEEAAPDVSGRAPALGTSATAPSRDALQDGSRHAVASEKVELADLQGNWRLICTSIDAGKNEASRIKHVVKNATITGNRISVTSPGEIVPRPFVLHLADNAAPQPIDLEFVLSASEAQEIEQLIDAYPSRDGKPIALGVIERLGGGFRICLCNEDMKTVGRPQAFELGERVEIWELHPL